MNGWVDERITSWLHEWMDGDEFALMLGRCFSHTLSLLYLHIFVCEYFSLLFFISACLHILTLKVSEKSINIRNIDDIHTVHVSINSWNHELHEQ